MKSKRSEYIILKIRFLLIIIFILSVNCIASVVSDNDGSAFITKSEFDILKGSFQSQIDNYNRSIDSKIDGAIAAYLAGIRVQNVKDGYLNILAETQSFGTSFTLFAPAIGDKINGYFNVGVFKTKASGTSQCTQLQHLTGAINHPAWHSTGTIDGHYLVGDFYDNDTNPTKFVLKNQTITTYTGILTGFVTSGGGNPTGSAPTNESMNDNIFTKGDYTAVGTYNDTYEIDLANVSSIAVTKGWSFVDTITNVDTNVLSGTKIDEDNDYFFVKSTELSNLGGDNDESDDSDIVGKLNPEWFGREVQASGISWRQWNTGKAITNNYLKIYPHKYKKIKLTQLVNETASNLIMQDVFLYQGLPVYAATNGTENVTITFTFDNDLSEDTYFVVKKGPFANEDMDTPHVSTTIALGNVLKATDGQKITFKIDGLTLGEMIWIKALPVDGKTTIKTEKIVVED